MFFCSVRHPFYTFGMPCILYLWYAIFYTFGMICYVGSYYYLHSDRMATTTHVVGKGGGVIVSALKSLIVVHAGALIVAWALIVV
jgi:hypothetical protein